MALNESVMLKLLKNKCFEGQNSYGSYYLYLEMVKYFDSDRPLELPVGRVGGSITATSLAPSPFTRGPLAADGTRYRVPSDGIPLGTHFWALLPWRLITAGE